jgi:hypothetical protein
MTDHLLWAGFFFIGMLMCAYNPKALGTTILYGLGLTVIYPEVEGATVLVFLYLISIVVIAFRP